MTELDVTQTADLLRFAEEVGRELRGADAAQWRGRMDSRYDECEQALRWFLDRDRADEGLRLALALVDYWQFSDRISDGREWLDRVLKARTTEDVLRAEVLFQAGLLAFWQGDDEAARTLHRRSLDLARMLGDPTEIALALTGVARVELRTDLDRARALCLEALDTVAGTDDVRGRSSAFHVLGVAAQMSREFPEARDWMSRRLDLARQMGDLRAVAGEAGNLSVVELELGNHGRAKELALEGLRLADQCGDAWMIPYDLNGLAAIDVKTGNHERAVKLLAAANRIVTQQGAAWPPDEGPLFERSRATAAQALSPAAFERAWSEGQAMSMADAVTYGLGSA
jgi:tetratricopeptide (TPR) repeat protein